jgi:hypothetical protein
MRNSDAVSWTDFVELHVLVLTEGSGAVLEPSFETVVE